MDCGLIGMELTAVSQIKGGKSHQFVSSVGCGEEDNCIGIAADAPNAHCGCRNRSVTNVPSEGI